MWILSCRAWVNLCSTLSEHRIICMLAQSVNRAFLSGSLHFSHPQSSFLIINERVSQISAVHWWQGSSLQSSRGARRLIKARALGNCQICREMNNPCMSPLPAKWIPQRVLFLLEGHPSDESPNRFIHRLHVGHHLAGFGGGSPSDRLTHTEAVYSRRYGYKSVTMVQ